MKLNCLLAKVRFLGLLAVFLLSSDLMYGQKDSVSYSVEFGSLYSDDENLPFYLHSNVGGIYNYNFNGPYIRSGLNGTYSFKEYGNVSYGTDLIISNQTDALNLQELYIKYNYSVVSIKAGKWELSNSGIDALSMGGFGLTNNARPIPKIGIFIDEYLKMPIFNGFVSFKGEVFHGWLENDRVIVSPLLHGKSGYIRLGDETISFTGGLNHYVIWSGTDRQTGVKLGKGLKDFGRVFIGDGLPDVPDGEGNGFGSHLGFWEFIASARIGETDISLGNQSSFEDGRSSQFWSLDENKDRKVALGIDFNSKPFYGIRSIVLEYMTTTFQQGPGLPDEFPIGVNNFGYPFGGRDDNYNNYLYRDGWTYHDRVIGNPLFIDRELGQYYFENIPDYGVSIINNRINAFHLGIEGNIKSVAFQLMSTFSKNYGTYAGLYEGRYNWEGIQRDPDFEYFFRDGLNQAYFLLRLMGKPFPKQRNLELAINFGLDYGEISRNVGFGFTLNYSGGF